MKRFGLLFAALLLTTAGAKDFKTGTNPLPTQPKAYSAEQRFANYVRKYPNQGIKTGAAAKTECKGSLEVLAEQEAAGKKAGKGYWAVGQTISWVSDNHVDISLEYMGLGALRQPDVSEQQTVFEEPHVQKSNPKHGFGTIGFSNMPGQAIDIDAYEYDSDPSTNGKTLMCLTILNAKK